MRVYHSDNEYICVFCEFCELPCLDGFDACNVCNKIFHSWCFNHENHYCLGCDDCASKKCKVYEKTITLKEKTSEKAEDLLDRFIRYKNALQSYESAIKILSSDIKIPSIIDELKKQYLLENQITNEYQLYEGDVFYVDSIFDNAHLNIIRNEVFFITKCTVCEKRFHSSKKDVILCRDCRNCHVCKRHIDIFAVDSFQVHHNPVLSNDGISYENLCYCRNCYLKIVLSEEYCPICMASWGSGDCVECEMCLRWIHANSICSKTLPKEKIDKISFVCRICTLFKNYWKNFSQRNIISNENVPKCYYCRCNFSNNHKISHDIVIISTNPYIISHRLCVYSSIKQIDSKNQLAILNKRKSHHCICCDRPFATICCIHCKDDYFHLNCTFREIKWRHLRSNVLLPVCETHSQKVTYEENYTMRILNIKKFVLDEENCNSQREFTSNHAPLPIFGRDLVKSPNFTSRFDLKIKRYEDFTSKGTKNTTRYILEQKPPQKSLNGYLGRLFPHKKAKPDVFNDESIYYHTEMDFQQIDYSKPLFNGLKSLKKKSTKSVSGAAVLSPKDLISEEKTSQKKKRNGNSSGILCSWPKALNLFFKRFLEGRACTDERITCSCIIMCNGFIIRNKNVFKCIIPTTDKGFHILSFDSQHIFLNGKQVHLEKFGVDIPNHPKGLKLDHFFMQAQYLIYPFFNHIIKNQYNTCLPLNLQTHNLVLTFNYKVCSSNSDFYLDVSRIHGKGLFAKRFYHPKEPIMAYEGEVIKTDACDEREFLYKQVGGDLYFFNIEKGANADSTIFGNFAKFINHSCEPNCLATHVRMGSKNTIFILTNRYINKGEELTYAYHARTIDNPCKCGATTCKKTL